MKRLLAVLVAVGLIAAAFLYRTRDDDGLAGPRDDGKPRIVVCSTELAEVCQALEDEAEPIQVRVEPAWLTFDRLSNEGEVDLDVWIAAGQWSEMLDERRRRNQQQPIFEDAVALAGTPLAVAIYNDDLAKLPCASAPTWACIGDAAASGIRLGAPDPDSEASGIAVVAATTGGYVGEAEFASNDLDASQQARVTDLSRRLDAHVGTTLATMLTTPALLDARADLKAMIDPVVATAASRDRVAVVVPDPEAIVSATAAGVGDRGDDVVQLLRGILERLLGEAGWGPPPDAKSDGLPSPGVFEALRGLLT